MKFADYQEKAKKTDLLDNDGEDIMVPYLGLVGEIGSVIEQFINWVQSNNNIGIHGDPINWQEHLSRK